MTTLNQAVKTFNQRMATQAALKNAQLTRERVMKLERIIDGDHRDLGALSAEFYYFQRAGFWHRLGWLIFGKVDK